MNTRKFIKGLEHIYPDKGTDCCIWKKVIEEELLEIADNKKVDLKKYGSYRCLLCTGYQTTCKDYIPKREIKFGGNGK